jgi:uncharacterized protein (TIGR01440 family)
LRTNKKEGILQMIQQAWTQEAETAVRELIAQADLKRGQVLVLGASSSEVAGARIGTSGSADVAEAVLSGILPVCREHGIYLAMQCCEHLNRALIIEKDYAQRYGIEIVNVVPQPKAGGSFATTCYKNFECPVAAEYVKADAGMDIGLTLIGMHLKHVAVPVRLSIDKIGCANVTFARTRPKCIGGIRAVYDDNIM